MKRLAPTLLAASLLAGALSAQPQTGDYIVATHTNTGRILRVATGGSTQTLASMPVGTNVQAVAMDAFNQSVVAVTESSTLDHFVLMTQTGSTSTIVQFPGNRVTSGIEIDQDGNFVVSRFDTIFKVNVPQRTLTTVASGLPTVVNAITMDNDTGDYIVGTTAGRLLRVDQITGQVSTIGTGLGSITGLDHDPRTGNFAVMVVGVLKIVNRSGSVVSSVQTSTGQAVKIDDEFGHYHCAGFQAIEVFDRNLSRIDSIAFPTTLNLGSIEIYGSRKVSGIGSGQRGSIYTMRLKFLRTTSGSFGCGLSLAGLRPGLRLAGRVINIAPDPLFFLSASNQLDGFFTQNFVGLLTAGRAAASFTIPPYLPVGSTVYAAANAVNTSLPGNLDFGNTIAVSVR